MVEAMCANIIKNTRYEHLTEAEKDRILVLLAHDITAGVIGSKTKWAVNMVEAQTELLSEQGFTLLGRKEKSISYDFAIQHNAMAITASLCEDFISGTHPGSHIFPLLLAEMENNSYSREQIIESAAIGLKLAIYLNKKIGKPLGDNGYRVTGVIGTLAASAAISWLKYNSVEMALKAMGIATSAVNGFSFPFAAGTDEWLVQAPIAANTASLAVRMAGSLSFHVSSFFSGQHSLGRMLEIDLGNEDHLDKINLLDIGIKRHSVNSFVQPVIEALSRLGEIQHSSIEQVCIRVPEYYQINNNLFQYGPFKMPNLGLLSIPASTALYLIKNRLTFEDFKDSNNSLVLETAKKIEILLDSNLKDYDTIVEIFGKNGSQSSSVETSIFYPDLSDELKWIEEKTDAGFWVNHYMKAWIKEPI